MRLKIDNFAKVEHADILIDGITVIAGDNNTGKSTIGKTLYAAFNSLYNLNEKIEYRREEEMKAICRQYFSNLRSRSYYNEERAFPVNYGYPRVTINRFASELVDRLMELGDSSLSKEIYKELLFETLTRQNFKINNEQAEEFIDLTYDKILLRKKNDNYIIALELIQRFFSQIFNDQMQCLKKAKSEANIALTIKNRDIVLKFKENECVNLQADYDILHEAFFLDDPFVLDELSYYSLSNAIRSELKRRLLTAKDDIMDGLFDAVSAKESLKEIYDILNKVVAGDILKINERWELKEEQFDEPTNFENLSAGLKSFLLIKILLEKGVLKKEDVLILDEPEIHLHPQWQLYYAEIIVLLQKKFDLNIIVTTHSSHFLEAVEYYSKKYELEHKCNYYLSKMENGLAQFQNMTDSLDKIYKQMVTPSMLLDKLKYELVDEDD